MSSDKIARLGYFLPACTPGNSGIDPKTTEAFTALVDPILNSFEGQEGNNLAAILLPNLIATTKAEQLGGKYFPESQVIQPRIAFINPIAGNWPFSRPNYRILRLNGQLDNFNRIPDSTQPDELSVRVKLMDDDERRLAWGFITRTLMPALSTNYNYAKVYTGKGKETAFFMKKMICCTCEP